jgi:uncharacterized protein
MLEPHRPGIPLPAPSAYTEPYWDGLRRGELRFLRCRNCQAALFDPPHICRSCRSRNLDWQTSSGAGTVYSWTVIWRPPMPAFAAPYAVAIVELQEGFRMLANIIGCEPSDVRVDLDVQAEFHDIGGGFRLPYFRPCSADRDQRTPSPRSDRPGEQT